MTTKPLTKSSAVGSLVTSLAEPAAKAVGEFLRDTAGEAIQGTYKWGRDKAYDAMTDTVSAPAPRERTTTYNEDGTIDDSGNLEQFKTFGGLKTPGGIWSDTKEQPIRSRMGDEKGQFDVREDKRLGTARSPEPEYRAGVGDQGPQFLAHFTKTKFPDIAKAFYQNPEAVGQLAGAATVLGGLGLAGGAVGLGMGALKPKSEYSVPVQPSGGYSNQSVESAMASAGAKYELEEQKFQHNMALAQMREQSRIPGVQNTSMGAYGGSGMSSGAVMGLMQNQFGNTRQYF
jgi:hypothetical protein